MQHPNNKDEIKEAILKGGLVVAGRNSGKTFAMAEIIKEYPDTIVLVGSQVQMVRIKQLLHDMGMSEREIEKRVFSAAKANDNRVNHFRDFLNKKVLIDEYFKQGYYWNGPFHAAVTSFPFPVRLIGE